MLGVTKGAPGKAGGSAHPWDRPLAKQAEPSTGQDRQEEFGIRGQTADGFTRAPTQKLGEDLSPPIFSNLSKNWRWIHPTGTAQPPKPKTLTAALLRFF